MGLLARPGSIGTSAWTLFRIVSRVLAPPILILFLSFTLEWNSVAHAAPPALSKLTPRGLQSGATTTIVVEGSNLLPNPQLLLGLPITSQTLKPGGTANRIELEIALPKDNVPSGVHAVRVVTDDGVSNAVALPVDPLPQLPFAAEIAALPVALHGTLSGNQILRTSFPGKKDEEVVVEIEARRFDSAINPVLHLVDHRRTQIAWSQELSSLGGDARIVAKLPADGVYTVELHDALYQAGGPGLFRLKIGVFPLADFMLPLGIQQGKDAAVQWIGGGRQPTAASNVRQRAGQLLQEQPLVGNPTLIGFRPKFTASEFPEFLHDPDAKNTEPPNVPLGISGRLSKQKENVHPIAVEPGKKLQIQVFAQRIGSPLDGVLFVRDEKGNQLATNDDQKGTPDPGLEFTVPANVKLLNLAVKDMAGRTGEDFVYRMTINESVVNDFSLSLAEDRWQISAAGRTVIRVDANRKGYAGPIRLKVENLPQGIRFGQQDIPAEANAALIEIANETSGRMAGLFSIAGFSEEPTPRGRAARPPENGSLRMVPWLQSELALTTTTAKAVAIQWDNPSPDEVWTLGASQSAHVSIARPEGVAGAVRLSLVTSQLIPKKGGKPSPPPKKPAKAAKNPPPPEKPDDDLDRALRLEELVTIPADKTEETLRIVVPGDLAIIPYDLAIRGELLSADGKNVVATSYSPIRRVRVAQAVRLELTGGDKVEAKAGLGETGIIRGKVVRKPGFTGAMLVTVEGLPGGVTSNSLEIPGEKSDFEFPVSVNYTAKLGEIKNAKLVAVGVPTDDVPVGVRSNEIGVTLNVVLGEKPPVLPPRILFEDDKSFIEPATAGNGKIAIVTDDKFSGAAAVKVSEGQFTRTNFPDWAIKIREKPGPNEYRFLRYAWKKNGGEQICLQLHHDGAWGPTEANPGKFRYHAGSGDCFGGSLRIDEKIPKNWIVVTRDLFADFGEFTLTGIGLSPLDGESGLFDHIQLGTSIADLDSVK